MRFRQVRVSRLAQGQRAQEWQHALENLDPSRIQVLKPPAPNAEAAAATTGDTVFLLRLASRPIILKLRPLNSWKRRLQHATGTGQFRRHWQGTLLLEQASIPTAPCLALGTLRNPASPAIVVEWLATSFIEGPTLLHALARVRGSPGEIPLAQAAGRLLAGLAKATPRPLSNRDHKPSNIMLVFPWDGRGPMPKLAIIDPVGVRQIVARAPSSNANNNDLAMMLASLLIEPIGCAIAPSVIARRACVHVLASTLSMSQGDARRLWQTAKSIIQSHGDPTPRVNPLEPPGD